MKLERVFDIPIFYDFLNLNLKPLEEYAYRLQGQSEGVTKSNKLGWQSHDILQDEELLELKNIIQKKLNEIEKYSNLKSNFKLNISNMWVNINKKYSYNVSHIHNDSFYSGVFYVKVPENSGRIKFEHPSQMQKSFMFQFTQFFSSFRDFTATKWVYDSKPNMLLLFPSWLEHNVDQNLSDFDRISIAFNTIIQ